MGHRWEQKLATPYSLDERAEPDAGTRLARRLGVHLDGVAALEGLVHADLDVERGGIGWWARNSSSALHVFVGDYLYQAVVSIQRNFVEAAIHLLDAADAWQQESELVRRGTYDLRANKIFPMPRSPADDLPGPLADAQAGGFFRAIGSAFDCLAASIVAIAPLPIPIRSVTWTRLRTAIERSRVSHSPGAAPMATQEILRLVDDSGPRDWTVWALSIRNMLVHHPRRINTRFIVPASPEIHLPGRGVHQPTRVVALFQRRPFRSEVEEWFSGGSPTDIVLHEPATETMSGVLEHALALHDAIAVCLIGVWKQRRRDPVLAEQPLDRQWAPRPGGEADSFEGFNPRAFGDEALGALRNISTSEVDARRMKAAAAWRDEPVWAEPQPGESSP